MALQFSIIMLFFHILAHLMISVVIQDSVKMATIYILCVNNIFKHFTHKMLLILFVLFVLVFPGGT